MSEHDEGAAAAPERDLTGARARQTRAAHHRRVAEAWRLRTAGRSWSEVAEAVGYANPENAIRACRRWRESLPTPDLDRLRDEALGRLEWLLREAYRDVEEDRPGAVTAAVRAEQHLAALMGLNRPTQVEIYTPASAELERWVAGMLAHTVPEVEEADVIVGELDSPGPGELEAAG